MSWRKEYLATLRTRDSKEQISRTAFDSYTRLADKVTRFPVLQSHAEHTNSQGQRSDRTETPLLSSTTLTTILRMRQDLAQAQRNRGELQSCLTSLTADHESMQRLLKLDRRQLNELMAEKVGLTVKLRDKDEELREKAKLIQNVHDETLSLTVQLNMAEQRTSTLQNENKELVDRWMARMGKEAEAMNSASKFS